MANPRRNVLPGPFLTHIAQNLDFRCSRAKVYGGTWMTSPEPGERCAQTQNLHHSSSSATVLQRAPIFRHNLQPLFRLPSTRLLVSRHACAFEVPRCRLMHDPLCQSVFVNPCIVHPVQVHETTTNTMNGKSLADGMDSRGRKTVQKPETCTLTCAQYIWLFKGFFLRSLNGRIF